MSVDNSHIIDFLASDPSGEVILVMVEGRQWDGSDERLFELQEKINTYVSFAVNGQLVEEYPYLAGKPVRLELRCVDPPDDKTASFLEIVHGKLAEVGLAFNVQQIRRDPSG